MIYSFYNSLCRKYFEISLLCAGGALTPRHLLVIALAFLFVGITLHHHALFPFLLGLAVLGAPLLREWWLHAIGDVQSAPQTTQADEQPDEAQIYDKIEALRHDIMSPLSSIKGVHDILESTTLTRAQREHLQMLPLAVDMVKSILDSDLPGQANGEKSLNSVETRHFLENILALFKDKAAIKQIKLLYRQDPEVPATAQLHSVHLSRVLLNLLSNAINYTQKGSITLHAGMQANAHTKQKMLLIEVADTGVGISSSGLAKIFEPFYRANNAATHHIAGSGLGLAISTALIKKMGGRITVESSPERGSCFCIEVPIHADEQNTPARTQAQTRVLVLDDQPSACLLWARQNLPAAMRVSCLSSRGEAAKSALQRIAHDGKNAAFDGIFIEKLSRPLLKTFASLLQKAAVHVPVFSRQAHPHLQKNLQVMHVGETMKRKALLEMIQEKASRRKDIFLDARLLIVEDNAVSARILRALLAPHLQQVEYVHTAEAAIRFIDEHCPDIVLMDVHLPGMSGAEAATAIKARECSSPVIIGLTGDNLHTKRASLSEAGMDHILSKPYDKAEIISLLQQLTPAVAAPVCEATKIRKAA